MRRVLFTFQPSAARSKGELHSSINFHLFSPFFKQVWSENTTTLEYLQSTEW